MSKNFFRAFVASPLIILFVVAFSFAQTAPSKNFPNIKIKNFGQMDDHYYRGAQPEPDDYKSLAALGVKTIIDLRDDPVSYEKADTEAAGMKYINIPMSDNNYPKPESIETFLKIANDPATGVFYAHCKGGKHRTGITGAAYRLTKDGWDFDKVYLEMKNYAFYSNWGYGAMKDFVVDYAANIKTQSTAVNNKAKVETPK